VLTRHSRAPAALGLASLALVGRSLAQPLPGAAVDDAEITATAASASSASPGEQPPATGAAPQAALSAGVTGSAPTPAPPAPLPASPTSTASPAAPALLSGPEQPQSLEVDISGYLQVQYESHQDSENQLRQGGTLLNQNRFLVRRGRLQFSRTWQYTAFEVELDGNTTNGASFGLFRAEATIHTPRPKDAAKPPAAALTAGLFRLPFGWEQPESARTRWFMERSTLARALWPVETDVGVRLSGGVMFLRYGISLTNGEPPGQKSGYPLQDPNTRKDVTARFGAEGELFPKLMVSGGVSFSRGKGFHAGTSATKDSIGWRDLNENGNVDAGETYGIPGTPAIGSEDFDRWAAGADLQLCFESPLGKTTLLGEIVAASNMDRGLFVADPVLTHIDVREFGWYAAITQEVTRYAVAGFRIDSYDPNADILDTRSNKILPSTQRIRTLSPLIGAQLPDRARLVLQYDMIKDYLARDSLGVPADFRNNQWTLRLQVNL
jgi:hypothetical protein